MSQPHRDMNGKVNPLPATSLLLLLHPSFKEIRNPNPHNPLQLFQRKTPAKHRVKPQIDLTQSTSTRSKWHFSYAHSVKIEVEEEPGHKTPATPLPLSADVPKMLFANPASHKGSAAARQVLHNQSRIKTLQPSPLNGRLYPTVHLNHPRMKTLQKHRGTHQQPQPSRYFPLLNRR